MRRYAIVVAGGKGLRMGCDLPKQFIPLSGKPVLMYTLDAFYRWDSKIRIVLVLPKDQQAYWQMLCREIGCVVPHQVVDGGETRFHSVRNGLQCVLADLNADPNEEETTWVAVHDGVRPFVSKEVIDRCFDVVQTTDAVVPVLPVIDSLRKKTTDGSHPVDRSHYVTVQTPQVFRVDLLWKAYQQPYTDLFTDDASVVEAAGHTVAMVEGNRENIKLTTPFDRMIAEVYVQKEQYGNDLIF